MLFSWEEHSGRVPKICNPKWANSQAIQSMMRISDNLNPFHHSKNPETQLDKEIFEEIQKPN